MNFETKANLTEKIKLVSSTAKDRFVMWSEIISCSDLTSVLEVGVFKGDFARTILRTCPNVVKYYMIDPWRHLTDWNKPANKSDEEFVGIKLQAMKATDFARERRIVLEGKTTEVSDQIPENSLDFAYIDGDHTLRGISIDLLRVWPKMKTGSILAGDDFSETIWHHPSQFEPTFVFPMVVHFAEAMDCVIFALPFNQFAIVVDHSDESKFQFRDLTGRYSSTNVGVLIQKRSDEYVKFEALYGDFRFNENYKNLQISGLQKESGRIRGEIVKTVGDIKTPILRVLLPGENNNVKKAYCNFLNLENSQIVTTGLHDQVDYCWNFEHTRPDFGKFDCIISQAMLEHLIDPYKHMKDLAASLNNGGHLIMHTVIPGFPYHRYPIDCMRFFPDWFEGVASRLELEICDKFIGELRIMYKLRKAQAG